MFDDHPSTPQANVPSNLPIGEPPDIFEGTEAEIPISPAPVNLDMPSSAALAPASSALNAGILTPKTPVSQSSVPQAPSIMGGENTIKEPKLSRGIMVTIMVLVIAFVLLGSGWFVYRMFTKKPANIAVIPVDTVPTFTSTSTDSALPTTPSVDVVSTSSDAVDHEIIVGESPDSDGDGLKDEREKELGTDPNNWDSDTDNLSDGEEVLIWRTNPKNADTDSDTYKDGAEVKSGYNPSGPGRLTEILTASTSSSSTVPVLNSSASSSTNLATSSTAATTSFEIAPIVVSSSSDIEL
ncbi:MAG: hypothetical protein A3B90_01225 [Candidatus Magasanikbacteria bacterium RIFCSPHIGHO2_02_FULL_41_13]|uniref:Uncharacterized protein n=1 Tax=Candidatus Magasanikbacteria bacterium RIFCSPHIGHO2_02_FULL_41_13 TaxID=1798676 RepID=A0A1F6M420_9BACT|nr:MAG: hypothetical protein A3B90_01225 [Candidatus Magasanikbacteria bacterium RIFCSPHIGHO2_02_FULL_41_13]